MIRLRDFFLRRKRTDPAPPPAEFFCLYCNAKFPHEDLPRVIAHLKPHRTRDEAEARLPGADGGSRTAV